jgi:hypothetical protein
LVGAAIGAAGGMAGKLVADLVDPQMEDEFWQKNWSDRKYIDGGFTYNQDWGPRIAMAPMRIPAARGRGSRTAASHDAAVDSEQARAVEYRGVTGSAPRRSRAHSGRSSSAAHRWDIGAGAAGISMYSRDIARAKHT